MNLLKKSPANFDFHFYKHNAFIIVITAILIYVGNYWRALNTSSHVLIIEHIQSFMLFGMMIYTLIYAKRYAGSDKDKYVFWIWTAFFWLMIFGRGISWGRAFFPDFPKIYFRSISVVLVGIPILGLLLPAIRREIVRRFKFEAIPVWSILLAFILLGMVEIVEHNRIGQSLLLHFSERIDLVEELIEVPCFLSLIFAVLYMQKNEPQKRI